MPLWLRAVGDGGHRDVVVEPDGSVIGRGESTGVYSAGISRQHCYLTSQLGPPLILQVRLLGRNDVVVLPSGRTSMSFRASQGSTVSLHPGDRVSLLPTGEYLYEVVGKGESDEGIPPEPGSPLVDDTDDEGGVTAADGKVKWDFRRVSSTSNKTPSDIAQEVKQQPEEEEEEEVLPRKKVKTANEAASPPVAPLPPCKYGAACSRKNPAHFLEFSHPNAGPGQLAAKPPCKYGAGCTRKNRTHFEQFSHPPAPQEPPSQSLDEPEEEVDVEAKGDILDPALRAQRAIDGVIPDRYMFEDELVYALGCGEKYKMKYTYQGYYCTCVAWKYQDGAPNARTCKHLKQYLGAEFEAKRCGLPSPGAKGGAAAKKGSPRKKAMPGVLLADKWNEKSDVTGWWMSEKLDGVRAYWDGENFLSRNGNIFTAPDWFVEKLPSGACLDGELFGGRSNFQFTVSVVKSQADHKGWKAVTYEVFDMPSEKKPWEGRMASMRESLKGCGSHVHIVDQVKCTGAAHVQSELTRITGAGGEGVMLRQPGSMYAHTRSSTLLKVKKFLDCEAIVVAHENGKGKHASRLGALVCKLASGKQFNVGTGFTDKQRDDPPAIGAVVTIKYQELTKGGVPRFPVYLGVRIDATWPPTK